MPDNDEALPSVPESRAVPRRRTRLSPVWLIPIVAAVAGVWVAVTRILGEGPEITIVFQTAEGLEAGKTRIDYAGVTMGTLTKIRLSDDHGHVIGTAQMEPKTEGFLVDDTKFWVVRPRISGGTVTGLSTLVSGAYVDMQIGSSSKARRRFEALVEPPIEVGNAPGRVFVLETPDLGSLDRGTPIFFRRLKVGQIASYELREDGQSFRVKAFVRAPYDQYVTASTRFWHASGVDLSLSANGLRVQSQSLVSILIGGVAFETPATGPVLPPADEGATFTLFEDRGEAIRPAPRHPQAYVAVFEQDARGLVAGAPVEFRGIRIGEVVDVTGRLDPKNLDFAVRVTLNLDAERFGVDVGDREAGAEPDAERRKLIDALVARGVRAQLRTGSLLSGALYIALDFFPDAPSATVDWSQHPAQLPTTPGQIEQIEESLASIVRKLDQLPLKEIGDDLQRSIVELDRTLASARGTFDDASALIEPNSVLGQQLDGTLQEMSGAARAVRLLADYLDRHPEALLRGKTGETR